MTGFLPKAIMNTILAALASVSSVLLVTTAFDISVSVPLLGLSTLIISGIFCCCFQRKKLLLFALPAMLIAIAIGIFTGFFDSLLPTAQQFLHEIFTLFESAYPNYGLTVPSPPAEGVTISYTLLFSVTAWILSIWMAWGVGFRSSIITVAGSLPLLLICLLVNDTPPSAIPLAFLMTVWITLLLSVIRPEDHPAIEVARMGLILLATFILVGTVTLFFPKENITRDQLPEFIQEILEQLPGPVQEVLTPDSQQPKDKNLGADVSEILDLTTQGPRDREDTVMMQLSTTEAGVLYLRAAAKDVYTGSTWESMDMADPVESIYAHTSVGTSFGSNNQAGVQIRNYKDAGEVVFAPYGYINCNNAEDITSDLRITMLEDDYIIYYWPGVRSMDITTASGIVSVAYDGYVEDVCLALPADTKEALYEMALECGYDPEMDEFETIAWVAQFIRNAGTYELNVDYQPAEEDFALYFLNYSRRGYCVHFATAATAMYRALGIPARYASGYRVNVPEAGVVTDVIDQDTHAWTEVYISGIGWIPVETTPGFGEATALPKVEQEVEQPPEPSPEPEAESGANPAPTPTPTPTPEPEDPLVEAANQAGQGVRKSMVWVIPILLFLLMAFTIVRRITLSIRRKKRFKKTQNNQSVIYMYHHLEKVCRYGPEMPEDLEAIALKAKFSRHEITAQERDTMYHGIRNLTKATEKSLTFFRKLRFRWISCLHMK